MNRSFLTILILLSTPILLNSKNNEQKSPQDDSAQKINDTASTMDLNKFQESQGPDTAQVYKWDFSKPFSIQYKLETKTDVVIEQTYQGKIMVEANGCGEISVQSNKDHSARMDLKNLTLKVKMTTQTKNQNGEELNDINENKVTSPDEVVKEAGETQLLHYSFNYKSLNLKIDLPDKTIGLHEEIESTLKNVEFTDILDLTITSTWKLNKFVSIDNKQYAQLLMRLSKSECATKNPGIQATCHINGTSIVYYSMENRTIHLEESYIDVEIIVSEVIPEDSTLVYDEDAPDPDNPEPFYYKMKTSLYSLTTPIVDPNSKPICEKN